MPVPVCFECKSVNVNTDGYSTQWCQRGHGRVCNFCSPEYTSRNKATSTKLREVPKELCTAACANSHQQVTLAMFATRSTTPCRCNLHPCAAHLIQQEVMFDGPQPSQQLCILHHQVKQGCAGTLQSLIDGVDITTRCIISDVDGAAHRRCDLVTTLTNGI